jgi:hypothetical protein
MLEHRHRADHQVDVAEDPALEVKSDPADAGAHRGRGDDQLHPPFLGTPAHRGSALRRLSRLEAGRAPLTKVVPIAV